MINSASSFWLFVVGMFAVTQIHIMGSIGISEIPVYVLAPVLFFRRYRVLRRDGFLPLIWLSVLCCIGCIISSMVNATPMPLAMKGFATAYSLFAFLVIYYCLLRKNLDGLKWLLIGLFVSHIIHVFIFQPETFTFANGEIAVGDAAVAAVMGYALFWTVRIGMLLFLPIQGWFMGTPLIYSMIAPVFVAGYSIWASNSSGRSRAIVMVAAMIMICIGGKSRRRMRRLSKNVVLFGLLMFVLLLVLKFSYIAAAKTGLLGYDARVKYERQSEMGDSTLRLLMAGRQEFFAGLRACFDYPFIGLGPSPRDDNGYYLDFLLKYGTSDEYRQAVEYYRHHLSEGWMIIPSHSYLVGFWLHYGIIGLILWLYVLFLLYDYFRHNISAIPQWFGYFCLAIPTCIWNIFFSPYGDRTITPILLTCLLLARAVSKGRIALPLEFELEARKYE